MTSKILKDNLDDAIRALLAGDVVGLPTETVYGLAGNPFDEKAVLRIFSAKNRPLFDPLILHVSKRWKTLKHLEDACLIQTSNWGLQRRALCQALMDRFWPGPLTILFPRNKQHVSDLVVSGSEFVAIRMPAHVVAQQVLTAVDFPLAAPSANRFGHISPTSPLDVLAELGDKLDYIIDGGLCSYGLESTIVYVPNPREIEVLRPGAISVEELKNGAEMPLEVIVRSSGAKVVSPGSMSSHYAPRKPMKLWEASKRETQDIQMGESWALLLASQEDEASLRQFVTFPGEPSQVVYLTKSHSDLEAASQLFSTLRSLDQNEAVQQILAVSCSSEKGLWYAINDRLRRASKR